MNSSKTQINFIEQLAKAKSSLNIFFLLSLDLFCIRGQDGYFNQLNPAWEKVLGWTSSELLRAPWIEFVHPDDVEVTLKAETSCIKEHVAEYENRYRHNDGSYRWLYWRVIQDKDGLSYAVGKDITATKRVWSKTVGDREDKGDKRDKGDKGDYSYQPEEVLSESTAPTLRNRLELERLITTLSTQFINLSLEEIDAGIKHALQVIGELAGFDRNSIVLFRDREAGGRTDATDGLEAKLAYQWSTESVEPWPREVSQASPASFPWWMEKLRNFEAIQVSCRADLPPEADNEKRAMQLTDTQAFIAVPLVQGRSLIGYVAFAVLEEEKTWSDDIVALLKILGDIFANALNRKQVESKLRESERRWSAVFNQTFQCSSLLKLDGRVLETNQTAIDFYKLERSKVVGHPFWELKCWTISPETQERLRKAIASSASGNVVRYEVDILAPDNTVVTIDFSLKPLRDETGQVELLIAEARDLTKRKQTEAALQKVLSELEAKVEERTADLKQANEQLQAEIAERQRTAVALAQREKQFRRAFNEAPIGIVLADVEGRFFRVNQAIIQMLGYTKSELLAFNFIEVTHPEDLERELPYIEQVINKELDGYQIEKRFFKKSREILWVSMTSVAMRDEAGEILYALAMIEDITKRKQTEIALRQSEELFRRVFDEAPLGIGLTSRDGYFFRVNQALQNMLGYTESEFKALTCKAITHPEDWKRKLPYIEQVKKGEIESFQTQERYLKKNQEILWASLTSMMLKSETGEILYGLGLLEDVTERKQAEAEILKALEKERELSELRSNFVSLVSHEFRTPLTTILSSTELLERYSQRLSDDKKLNHLRRIQNAVLRMTQLLEDILTIGKAEAGKLKFEPSPINLVAFCHEIVESMQMSARPHHTLNFVPLCEVTNAWVDEKLLGHVITNLLSNAIKYSPQGGTVQFDLVCTSTWAIFRVQDTGIGIPREDLENLFESFRRASNVGTIPGTGLGLAIVKKCVELHGGRIAVESEVGMGTTFTVTLPLSEVAQRCDRRR